jgi:alpha-L-fucosidase
LKPISRRTFLAASGASLSLAALGPRLESLPFGAPQRGAPDYEATLESLSNHPIPRWYEDAKFGVFFHIGVYTVPAWAPLPPGPLTNPGGGQYYAEQYMVQLMTPESATWAHHRDVYGTQFIYDDFIPQYRVEKFDPERWIKLAVDAGARYFVPTAKHREGFSNFRTRTTHRNSVDMGPRRDLIKDLVTTARRTSDLKVGIYYGLQDTFSPAYAGEPPRNPYTGEVIPYAGYQPINDYVQDALHPQFKEIIDKYDPDLLWGDAQFAKPRSYWRMPEIIAHFYNNAKNRPKPKEVVADTRTVLGIGDDFTTLDVPGFFTTPEYTGVADIKTSKWELSRGIGNSFAYNQLETEAQYSSAADLVHLLIDVVSKNGNLLLNAGVKSDGTIVPAQEERLREVGRWLRINGDAIYGSRPWMQFEDPGANVPVRFTRGAKAFYVIALAWPDKALTLSAAVPIEKDPEIRLLGGGSKRLSWHRDADRLVIDMPKDGASATRSQHAYAFEIKPSGR